MNSFTGANLDVRNAGIRMILSEVMTFRKQLVVRSEFQSQSGWNTQLNQYMMRQLERISDTIRRITYNPENKQQQELALEAADTERNLEDDFNEMSLSVDNVVLPSSPAISHLLPWDLSGNHPDVPQLTPENCPNDAGRAFVQHLDEFFVQMTRLDSRHEPYQISKMESAMASALLNVAYTICIVKGGEASRAEIPTGTLPSQDVNTFTGAK